MLRDRLDGVAEVAQQMPPVRDLDSFWRSLPDAISVDAGAAARGATPPGVPLQPRRKALSPAVGQEVEYPVLLQVDEDGPIAVTAPPCPVIDPKHARGGRGPGAGSPRRAIRSNVSGLMGMASLAARRAPASPPTTRPRGRCRSPSRLVRRAAGPAVSPRRSAKVRRTQAGFRHRTRRTRTRNVTGRPCQGRSPSVRSYRLCTRPDSAAQSGQAAVFGRAVATIVRWSGEGRICWTSSPAGIKGKRRLGKDDFRRGAMFLLCAHPAPERRPRGTQTAGEP